MTDLGTATTPDGPVEDVLFRHYLPMAREMAQA